jgi:SAM-dependent methyltransferase
VTDPLRGRDRWAERYATDPWDARAPSAWVMQACARIPGASCLVDIAAGAGRHAAPLARTGRSVIAVDFVEMAIRQAARHGGVLGVVADAWSLPFADGTLEAILCTNFLERDLIESLKALLRPGGYLIYETYTSDHLRLVEEKRARAPRSASYLLKPGELTRLLSPFRILDSREGLVDDSAGERYCASALAQRPQEEHRGPTGL